MCFPTPNSTTWACSPCWMAEAGLEILQEEGLRAHYALTLRHWVSNLEDHWDAAVAKSSAGRARVWRLYMAASAVAFERAALQVHQIPGREAGRRGGAEFAAPASRL